MSETEEKISQRFLVINVEDSGIGIPEDKQDRIFKHFTQVDASTTRRFGGTGLGLAISKQLVELMGGVISFTSEEGKGTTFSVRIPLPDVTVATGEAYKSGLLSEGSSELGDVLLVTQKIARVNILVVGPCEVQLSDFSTNPWPLFTNLVSTFR